MTENADRLHGLLLLMDDELKKDLQTLVRFIGIYCANKHPTADKETPKLKTHDLTTLVEAPPQLCTSCTKLLTHAFVKRSTCPMEPKPACKHCPEHCYHPAYRQHIREVMKYSGRRLVLSGRLDYLLDLLF